MKEKYSSPLVEIVEAELRSSILDGSFGNGEGIVLSWSDFDDEFYYE